MHLRPVVVPCLINRPRTKKGKFKNIIIIIIMIIIIIIIYTLCLYNIWQNG